VAEILDVSDATFEQQIMKSDLPVLVDFWAEWCAPCRQLAPVIKQIAEEYGPRLRVAKVDTDANPRTASRLGIQALPTLLVIKGGEVKAQLVGYQPKVRIAQKLDEILTA
jgi:thioredoxin 1